jgi:hypothetical protein
VRKLPRSSRACVRKTELVMAKIASCDHYPRYAIFRNWKGQPLEIRDKKADLIPPVGASKSSKLSIKHWKIAHSKI